MPLIGAPTALIVHVPCPWKSWIVGSVGTNERLSATSRFGATSGCVMSAPVSITKTLTSLRPRWTAYEPVLVALSFFLSHCSKPSESGIGCVSEPVDEAVPPLLPASAICASRFDGSIVGSTDAIDAGPTAFTPAFACSAAAKFGFVDVTPMPPIFASRIVIVPPALATIWSTFAGRPFGLLNATEYRTGVVPPVAAPAMVNAATATAAATIAKRNFLIWKRPFLPVPRLPRESDRTIERSLPEEKRPARGSGVALQDRRQVPLRRIGDHRHRLPVRQGLAFLAFQLLFGQLVPRLILLAHRPSSRFPGHYPGRDERNRGPVSGCRCRLGSSER